MSNFLKLLSDIDPTAAPKSPITSARQTQATSVPRPPPRPTSATNGTSQHQPPLKRKADGPPDGVQPKVARKEGVSTSVRPNGTSRPATSADIAKAKPGTPTNTIPYRGTAGSGGMTKPVPTAVKKQSPAASAPAPVAKPSAPTPKATVAATSSGATAVAVKQGRYAALLQKAKEVQQAKPPTPPVKVEQPKFLTKRERLALRAEASAAAKGKKSGLSGPPGTAKSREGSNDPKEKRKPTELGYQGTARPAKKPVEIGYKGTARPQASTAGPAGRASSAPAAKPKPKISEGRYSGYADWDELDEMDDEEEDYESESDMEGGLWDVEEEEQMALKVAKKEDAEALAEENELKRQKEERKRKLAAMNKAAANKRKY